MKDELTFLLAGSLGTIALTAVFNTIAYFARNRREDKLRWVTDRRKHYVELLAELEQSFRDGQRLIKIRAAGTMREEAADAHERLEDHWIQVTGALAVTRLVDAPKVIDAADELYLVVADEVNRSFKKITEIQEVVLGCDERREEYKNARKRFELAARRDLSA